MSFDVQLFGLGVGRASGERCLKHRMPRPAGGRSGLQQLTLRDLCGYGQPSRSPGPPAPRNLVEVDTQPERGAPWGYGWGRTPRPIPGQSSPPPARGPLEPVSGAMLSLAERLVVAIRGRLQQRKQAFPDAIRRLFVGCVVVQTIDDR